MRTTPRGQPGPATRQPARLEDRDPNAASAPIVASGSRSSMRLPAGDDPGILTSAQAVRRARRSSQREPEHAPDVGATKRSRTRACAWQSLVFAGQHSHVRSGTAQL